MRVWPGWLDQTSPQRASRITASPAATTLANTSAGPISTGPANWKGSRTWSAFIAWLADKVPADDSRVALVHGDWRIDNMIFDANSPRLLAVLDWELSTLGHPFADLAYQCMQWRLPAGRYRRNSAASTGRRAAYRPRPNTSRPIAGESSDLPFDLLIAFSFFRSIAIHQGVYKRWLDGNA